MIRRALRSRLRGATRLCGAAALAALLGGCANNMTGFDFPTFGLIDRGADQEQSLPPAYQPTSRLGQ